MLRIVDYEDIKNVGIDTTYDIKKQIMLLSSKEIHVILDACKNNSEILKKWFNIIGIKYDNIRIIKNNIFYTVGDDELHVSQLSHGERIMLYILASKELHRKLVIHSLFERCGRKLTRLLDDILPDYNELVVVTYNRYATLKLAKYTIK